MGFLVDPGLVAEPVRKIKIVSLHLSNLLISSEATGELNIEVFNKLGTATEIQPLFSNSTTAIEDAFNRKRLLTEYVTAFH